MGDYTLSSGTAAESEAIMADQDPRGDAASVDGSDAAADQGAPDLRDVLDVDAPQDDAPDAQPADADATATQSSDDADGDDASAAPPQQSSDDDTQASAPVAAPAPQQSAPRRPQQRRGKDRHDDAPPAYDDEEAQLRKQLAALEAQARKDAMRAQIAKLSTPKGRAERAREEETLRLAKFARARNDIRGNKQWSRSVSGVLVMAIVGSVLTLAAVFALANWRGVLPREMPQMPERPAMPTLPEMEEDAQVAPEESATPPEPKAKKAKRAPQKRAPKPARRMKREAPPAPDVAPAPAATPDPSTLPIQQRRRLAGQTSMPFDEE